MGIKHTFQFTTPTNNIGRVLIPNTKGKGRGTARFTVMRYNSHGYQVITPNGVTSWVTHEDLSNFIMEGLLGVVE